MSRAWAGQHQATLIQNVGNIVSSNHGWLYLSFIFQNISMETDKYSDTYGSGAKDIDKDVGEITSRLVEASIDHCKDRGDGGDPDAISIPHGEESEEAEKDEKDNAYNPNVKTEGKLLESSDYFGNILIYKSVLLPRSLNTSAM